MKKATIVSILAIMIMALVAGCGKQPEYPQGISSAFHTDAWFNFDEIDDDTMELEPADQQDIANVELLIAQANSNKEKEVAESIKKLLELNARVINQEKDALKEYLQTRQSVIATMQFSKFYQVPKFQFTEE